MLCAVQSEVVRETDDLEDVEYRYQSPSLVLASRECFNDVLIFVHRYWQDFNHFQIELHECKDQRDSLVQG